MSLNKKGITVIICCYNSSYRIPETIRHLALQIVPPTVPWEVILVDNASTDNTSETAICEVQKYDGLYSRFQIVNEATPGLTYARIKGAKDARFEYLIFCDDDNWLDSGYLWNAFQIMESDSKIGALGGQSTAVTDDIEFPDWFESAKNGFAVGRQSPYQGDVSKTCMLWGAGLVTRKSLFFKCYTDKFPALMVDRKGNFLSSGGDNEFCYRLLLKGYKLFYDERLTFVHFISKVRWSPEYNQRLVFARQQGAYDTLELNKYFLLLKVANATPLSKLWFVLKTCLGYISTMLFSRKSWSLADTKVVIFFYFNIDLGVDGNTKDILRFYNEPITEDFSLT